VGSDSQSGIMGHDAGLGKTRADAS
jgi:hypothetical protein